MVRPAWTSARTVTLTPRPPLPLRGRRFLLTASGLTDRAGLALDGDGDGRPGGDFVATVGAEAFVPPAPLRIPTTEAFNRRAARDLLPAPFRSILQRVGLAAAR